MHRDGFEKDMSAERYKSVCLTRKSSSLFWGGVVELDARDMGFEASRGGKKGFERCLHNCRVNEKSVAISDSNPLLPKGAIFGSP